MTNKLKLWVLLVAVLLMRTNIWAIGVYPPLLEVELDPGDTTSTNISIYNKYNEEVYVRTAVAVWDDRDVTSSREWIAIDTADVIIPPVGHVTRTLTVSPTANKEVFTGEFSYYLYFNEYKKNSSFAVQIGVPLYVISNYNKKIDVKLTSFNITYNEDNKEIRTAVSFVNSGNVHVRPEVVLKLKNKQTGEYVANGNGETSFVITKDWPVFPESTRVLDGSVTGVAGLKKGEYLAELHVRHIYLFKEIASYTRTFEVKL